VEETRGSWQRPQLWRHAPWLFVAAACVFGLVTMSGELTNVQPLNDEALHFEMVRWAVQQIHSGNALPLDGWFPYLSLGDAQFSHYQSLPHLITAYISLVFGSDSTERWAGYLLFALFPLSVYAGSRLLGWSSWAAGTAALVSPLLVSVTGYGYESFSYTWLGNGLWSQEWGMFLLPLAWGVSWRAVEGTGRGKYALAALVVGLTIAMHFLTGYFALLSIGVFVIVVWRGVVPRIGRAAVVFGGAALVASWVVVPLISDGAYFNLSIFNQGTFWLNSYGAPQALGWLFTGQLFDYGRFPIVSLLVAVGTVVCICRFRSDRRARALLGLMAMSILLFCGRQPFGFILNLLPGNGDLYLSRYMMGIQLAGDLLAGIGLVWVGESAVRLAGSWRPRVRRVPLVAGLMAAAVLITLPAWVNRAAYAASDSTNVALQVDSDQTDGAALDVLINDIKSRGGGRTYAGLPGNWGQQYAIGQVPVYTYLADNDVDEFGFTMRTPSLTADNEAYFNQADPAQYQLYNIRYLLMPVGMTSPVPATLLASSGRHRLYQVTTSGYLEVVDTSGIVEANRGDMAAQTQPFLRSAAFQQGELATIAFNGGAAAPPTLPVGATPNVAAGTSADVVDEAQDGFFAGTVTATRTAAVILKVTYDPLWRATVDGVPAAPYMVVPGFVGVTVGPGQHSVVFQYVPYSHYGALLGIGAVTLLILGLGPWLWRRRLREMVGGGVTLLGRKLP
jgi:Bacterial membrane protein YfhO